MAGNHPSCTDLGPWAARCNTWLLILLTQESVLLLLVLLLSLLITQDRCSLFFSVDLGHRCGSISAVVLADHRCQSVCILGKGCKPPAISFVLVSTPWSSPDNVCLLSSAEPSNINVDTLSHCGNDLIKGFQQLSLSDACMCTGGTGLAIGNFLFSSSGSFGSRLC